MKEKITQFRNEFAGYTSAAIRSLIKESAEFRTRLERLYLEAFRRRLNKGCTSCWRDAYVLLMRYDIEKLTTMASRNFELKAGALLIDVKKGANDLMATHHNLTDELALYHLRTNPKCIKMFSKYPENWEELANADAEAPEVENTDNEVAPAEKKRRSKK